jgi:membrane protease YdiL (CAAX protease family)
MESFGNNPEIKNSKAPLANMHPALVIFLTLVVVFITYQLIGGGIVALLLAGDVSPESLEQKNVMLVRLVMSFSQFMFLLFPVLIINMLQGQTIKDTFRLKKPNMPVMWLSILAIFVVQPFLQVYLYFQNKLFFSLPIDENILRQIKEIFETFEKTTASLVNANSPGEFIIVVLVVAVTPAVCEEFLFRGLILKNFERFTIAYRAVVFTGLLFAFFHFHPFNILPLAVLGFFLSFITYYSGSIYPAIICHFLNNFTASLAYYLYGNEGLGETSVADNELMIYIAAGIISAVLFFIILRIILRISPVKPALPVNTEPSAQ